MQNHTVPRSKLSALGQGLRINEEDAAQSLVDQTLFYLSRRSNGTARFRVRFSYGFRTASLLAILLLPVTIWAQDVYVNAQVAWHPAVLDAQGKLLAWYHPEKNLGYDHVIRLGWDFIEHKVPQDTRHGTGLKIYLINSVFDAKTLQGRNWQHNPPNVFASFVDSLVGWYPYSGDVCIRFHWRWRGRRIVCPFPTVSLVLRFAGCCTTPPKPLRPCRRGARQWFRWWTGRQPPTRCRSPNHSRKWRVCLRRRAWWATVRLELPTAPLLSGCTGPDSLLGRSSRLHSAK